MTLKTRSSSAASLKDIQAPVAEALLRVNEEMWRIVAIDSEFFSGVNQHLMLMKGKMVRPTLMLLASQTDGTPQDRAAAYAAVVELIHLATLVHDLGSGLLQEHPAVEGAVNRAVKHRISIITAQSQAL